MNAYMTFDMQDWLSKQKRVRDLGKSKPPTPNITKEIDVPWNFVQQSEGLEDGVDNVTADGGTGTEDGCVSKLEGN